MTDKIDVTLSPDRLHVAPGETVTTIATIKNAGDVVEAYTLSVEGIDPQWCTLSVTSVSLFPGDQEQVQVTVQPPKASASAAGAHNAALKVASNRDPALQTSAPLSVDVGRFLFFDLALSPKKARGRKGSFTLSITNNGNVPTTYTLAGEDPDSVCNFEFPQSAIRVDPGATAEVPVVVDPRKKPFTGKAKSHSFTITVTSHASEAGETKTVQGQVECTPLMPLWAIVVSAVALVAVIAVVVLLLLMGSCGGGSSAPSVSISYSPSNPMTGDTVTYQAHASDPDGVDWVQIWVDGQFKAECPGSTCTFQEVYYLDRDVSYEARARDMLGNDGWVSPQVFHVSTP